jgi:hypothetical protein
MRISRDLRSKPPLQKGEEAPKAPKGDLISRFKLYSEENHPTSPHGARPPSFSKRVKSLELI